MRDTLWLAEAPLLLASTSATRRMLLESAGLPVEIEPPGVDERALDSVHRHATDALAPCLAAEKALAVSRRRPCRIVLGADQTLNLDTEILHKPADREDAGRQLARLAGRSHILTSAFAIAEDGVLRHEGLDTARLTMRALDDGAIARYLELVGDTALRSVGVYQLEGVGIHLFERIEGEHATILGLPLLPLLAALRAMRLVAL